MKDTHVICGACKEGTLADRILPERDVSALMGLKTVIAVNMPALVCKKCGKPTLRGDIIDLIYNSLAELIIQRPELSPSEAKFLRKLLGCTQEQLADRLGITRLTVGRWETGDDKIEGTNAYALRSLAYFNLHRKWEKVARIEPILAESAAVRKGPVRRRSEAYRIDARAAAAG